MIFYFTGTGNSLYAAKKLDSEAYSIPQVLNSEELVFKADKIGIVCPIYAHEMPAMVKKFIYKAEFQTDYLYVILTYGKRHANAVELAYDVICEAEKQAHYIATLLMVDNFLPVFDMTEEMKMDKAVDEQIEKIKIDIALKRHQIEKVTSKDHIIHKEYLQKVSYQAETVWADFIVTDECVGCGICTKVCPSGCITLQKQRAVYHKYECQACFACIHACPKMAIKMNMPEKNCKARYRNEHIQLAQIVVANNQTDN